MFSRHGQVRVQRVVLEHHRDVAVLRRHVGDVPVADPDRAGADVLQAREHAQGGRLAAAGGPDENEELAVADLQVEGVDRQVLCAGISPGDFVKGDRCHRASTPRPVGVGRTIRGHRSLAVFRSRGPMATSWRHYQALPARAVVPIVPCVGPLRHRVDPRADEAPLCGTPWGDAVPRARRRTPHPGMPISDAIPTATVSFVPGTTIPGHREDAEPDRTEWDSSRNILA